MSCIVLYVDELKCTVVRVKIGKRHSQRHVQWTGLIRIDGCEGIGTHTPPMQ